MAYTHGGRSQTGEERFEAYCGAECSHKVDRRRVAWMNATIATQNPLNKNVRVIKNQKLFISSGE